MWEQRVWSESGCKVYCECMRRLACVSDTLWATYVRVPLTQASSIIPEGQLLTFTNNAIEPCATLTHTLTARRHTLAVCPHLHSFESTCLVFVPLILLANTCSCEVHLPYHPSSATQHSLVGQRIIVLCGVLLGYYHLWSCEESGAASPGHLRPPWLSSPGVQHVLRHKPFT